MKTEAIRDTHYREFRTWKCIITGEHCLYDSCMALITEQTWQPCDKTMIVFLGTVSLFAMFFPLEHSFLKTFITEIYSLLLLL